MNADGFRDILFQIFYRAIEKYLHQERFSFAHVGNATNICVPIDCV